MLGRSSTVSNPSAPPSTDQVPPAGFRRGIRQEQPRASCNPAGASACMSPRLFSSMASSRSNAESSACSCRARSAEMSYQRAAAAWCCVIRGGANVIVRCARRVETQLQMWASRAPGVAPHLHRRRTADVPRHTNRIFRRARAVTGLIRPGCPSAHKDPACDHGIRTSCRAALPAREVELGRNTASSSRLPRSPLRPAHRHER